MMGKTASAKRGRPRSPKGDDLTPAMRQYAEQKAEVGEAILFFRMGDFYEMFHEDARTAARVLGLTLTARSKGENPIPLAGIPYHQLEPYLAKLVKAGFKVAISEQVEDPKQAKGVVKRAVVRIVTPGTLTDDALLDERADNYLAAFCPAGDAGGLAWVDLSTGAFQAQRLGGGDVIHELVRLRPSELLLPERDIGDELAVAGEFRRLAVGMIVNRPAHLFDAFHAERKLHEHFRVSTMSGFGWESIEPELCAAGAVLEYLQETQRSALGHILAIRRRDPADFVRIDQSTWRSLEIERNLRHGSREGSLLEAVDETVNPMGGRCLHRWLCAPLKDSASILARQEAVAELRHDTTTLGTLRTTLRHMADMERITARLGVGRVAPRDLWSLGGSLAALPKLREAIGPTGVVLLAETAGAMTGLDELCAFLERSLRPDAPLTVREGGIIAAGYNEELDRLRNIRTDGQRWLAEYQAREIERTGIGSLKVGFNSVFGYYLEITNTHKDLVPPEYVRKQTIKNAERYITDELKTFESEVLTAEERANELEYRLFEEIRAHVADHIPAIQSAASAVARLDVLAGLAHLANERRYVRPELTEANVLHITGGRHPVLEVTMSDPFVANDCRLDEADQRLLLITGPNMAGKSTYIRQVALLTLLAQAGSCVPADEMVWGIADRIFARVGASDEIARGQSTFMVEMTEAANILNSATDRSLVILDEIGRGTSTYDGLSLAWAITEHLANRIRSRTLFATHYHELTELANLLVGVKNLNVAVREYGDEVIFLHKIVAGAIDKSYGVHVARLAGIPRNVVARAREILAELESSFSRESRTEHLARQRTRQGDQLLLFEPAEDPIRSRLRDLDLDALTPLDALNLLKGWQEEA